MLQGNPSLTKYSVNHKSHLSCIRPRTSYFSTLSQGVRGKGASSDPGVSGFFLDFFAGVPIVCNL